MRFLMLAFFLASLAMPAKAEYRSMFGNYSTPNYTPQTFTQPTYSQPAPAPFMGQVNYGAPAVYVQPYTRNFGQTQVQGHYRSFSDGNPYNNFGYNR